ncbi:Putative transposable element [Caligus rogercresseyi]|uniref:Transposable element n=1 Tax=Caligus rogercresseyi TaxID=217165 RepID=A0A7T8HJB1_CALRO|nr:Putative transposable element [Caligus rogercresseyi]
MSLERDVRIRGHALLEDANDHYLSFGDVDEKREDLTTTKHPASVMSLDFVASNGKAMDIIWFLTGYRLTAGRLHRYPEDQNFPRGNVVLQQDGAPAHTEMDFWAKDLWPPQSSDANPLDYAFWPHIETKACNICHPNIDALKAAVNQEWAGMYEDFVKRLIAIVAANGGHIE